MKGAWSEAEAVRRWSDEILVSLTFLTRLPAGRWVIAPAPPLAEAMRAFPIVGAVLGIAGGLIFAAFAGLGSPPLLAGAIALTCLILLTGALHEDGLADMADGFGGRDRLDTLALMRDSHVGTFGVIALALALIAKAASLGELGDRPWYVAPLVLAGTGAFSRSLIVWLMGITPAARSDGLSASAGQPNWNSVRSALIIGGILGAVMLFLAGGIGMAVLALITGFVTAAVVRTLSLRKIGGQTGDICGAVQVLSETGMLALTAIMVP